MEHPNHTPSNHTGSNYSTSNYTAPNYTPPNYTPPSAASPGAASSGGAAPRRSTPAERKARTDWLVTELRRLAAATDNPHEQANLRRSADSLIRLATAFRP